MISQNTPKKVLLLLLVAMLLSTVLVLSATAQETDRGAASTLQDIAFEQVIEQGFGSRQNSYSWSMAWWRGKLYVGTSRSVLCVQHATGTLFYPKFVSYPPLDSDIECTESPQDLDLRGEIWRWTPETDEWERVYRSPMNVQIPGFPNKRVARDIGFRSMLVFREPNGKDALYVAGSSSNSFNPGVPGARILRSTDGETFGPISQKSGTFLGDLGATSFRSLTAFNGKLYVIAALGYGGYGPVLESSRPAQGDDFYHYAFPEEVTAFEMETFNNHLYIGTGANALAYPVDLNTPPFEVFKTAAQGEPPYETTTVIPDGGYRIQNPSRSVVSMHEFKNRLYVGTDRPAELYRIAANDSWQLVVGTARWTPDGIFYPISGMDVGFDNVNNIHIWRMQDHQGILYVGTMDQSTKWRDIPGLGDSLRPGMGFDLYRSGNGRNFRPITTNGFNDMFDVGVRSFASTSYGLFMGTANQYYGTKIWFMETDSETFSLYLPLVENGS